MSHPDFNAIAAFLEDRLDPAARAVFVQHVAECSECRGTLALYGRAAAGQPEAAVPARGPGAGRTLLRVWLPLAASVALATAAVILITGRPEPASEHMRVAADRPAVPAAPPAGQAPVLDPPAPPPQEPSPVPRPLPEPERPSPVTEGLLARRSGTVEVEGKTFRLEAGEWVDAAYDPMALLPVVRVRTADERDALLSRMPALAPYAALGPRVTVAVDGTVYRFDVPTP